MNGLALPFKMAQVGFCPHGTRCAIVAKFKAVMVGIPFAIEITLRYHRAASKAKMSVNHRGLPRK